MDTSKLGEHRPWAAWGRGAGVLALSRALGWSTRRPGPLLAPRPLLEMMPRLAVALALSAVSAFHAPLSQPRNALVRHAEDPTKVWYADLANGVQNLLQNSPLNEGKKAVVKMMAGGYDVAATNQKLDELIANPVVMLSFTK